MWRPLKDRSPLLYEPVSDNPIEIKLANMCAAIAAGADPNELDGSENLRVGRPLHYAICDDAFVNYENLKKNLPIVKLLLEAGADPRLPGVLVERYPTMGASPLQSLRLWLELFERDSTSFGPEDTALKPFYEAAYKEMKKVADKLDGMFA